MTRSRFLQLHLQEVNSIRQHGLSLIGYFHWSLFDNYEWANTRRASASIRSNMSPTLERAGRLVDRVKERLDHLFVQKEAA